MTTEVSFNTPAISPKSYAVAVCLSAVFGVIGIHHLYLRRYYEFVLDFSLFVLTVYCYFAGEFLWALGFAVVDGLHTFIITIMLLTGSFKDGDGKLVCYPGQRIA